MGARRRVASAMDLHKVSDQLKGSSDLPDDSSAKRWRQTSRTERYKGTRLRSRSSTTDYFVSLARSFAEATVPAPDVARRPSVHEDVNEREAMIAHFCMSRCTEALVRARLQNPSISWEEVRTREKIYTDTFTQPSTSVASVSQSVTTASEESTTAAADSTNVESAGSAAVARSDSEGKIGLGTVPVKRFTSCSWSEVSGATTMSTHVPSSMPTSTAESESESESTQAPGYERKAHGQDAGSVTGPDTRLAKAKPQDSPIPKWREVLPRSTTQAQRPPRDVYCSSPSLTTTGWPAMPPPAFAGPVVKPPLVAGAPPPPVAMRRGVGGLNSASPRPQRRATPRRA